MLAGWERDAPGRIDSIFKSLRTVVPSHLADTRLYDFAGLASGRADSDAGPPEREPFEDDAGL
jgi:tRNA 2-thiocytidine biosynthesis protein TtcA